MSAGRYGRGGALLNAADAVAAGNYYAIAVSVSVAAIQLTIVGHTGLLHYSIGGGKQSGIDVSHVVPKVVSARKI